MKKKFMKSFDKKSISEPYLIEIVIGNNGNQNCKLKMNDLQNQYSNFYSLSFKNTSNEVTKLSRS